MSPTSCQTAPPRISRGAIIQIVCGRYQALSVIGPEGPPTGLPEDGYTECPEPSWDDSEGQNSDCIQAKNDPGVSARLQ